MHDEEYVAATLAMCEMVQKRTFDLLILDPPFDDTVIAPGTKDCLLYGAGSVIHAVDTVMRGEAKNAFCAVRPPGPQAIYIYLFSYVFCSLLILISRVWNGGLFMTMWIPLIALITPNNPFNIAILPV